jgi:hypothetical protein
MVHIGVEVTVCSGIYGDGAKVGAAIGIPHLLTPLNGL